MEFNLNDIEFLYKLYKIFSDIYATYIQIMFFPLSFFNDLTLDWGKEYFVTGLFASSLVFCYIIPPQKYSKNPIVKWLLQIPLNKLMGLIAKFGIIYLSVLWSILWILIFIPFSMFSGVNSFIPHLKAMAHILGTIYLTVSFCLGIEHGVMIFIKKKSILKKLKVTIKRKKELNKKSKKEIQKDGKKEVEETFWQRVKRIVKSSAEIRLGCSKFQVILGYTLFVYSIVYPFFCLSILHL